MQVDEKFAGGSKPEIILTEEVINHAGRTIEWTAEEEAAVKRKIDMRM